MHPAVNPWLFQRFLPALLGSIAGSTDVIGFLGLGGLFTAHITGNFVVLAAHWVNHTEVPTAVLLSVPAFVAVLLLTKWLATRLDAVGICSLQSLLLLECMMLFGFLAVRVAGDSTLPLSAPSTIAAGMLAVAAMAVQNAVGLISLGAVSTTAMTTNVARFMLEISSTANSSEQIWRRIWMHQGWPPIAGFIIGCGLGAVCEAAFNRWSSALPTGLAICAFAITFSCRQKIRDLS